MSRSYSEYKKRQAAKKRREKKRKEAYINASVLNSIPDDYIDLFPEAREIERHFVLHIGPTNSGKTHDAMEALKEAGSGIYLGPLRLLAYEQYDSLNRQGYPCDLVTGEERYEIPGADFQSSTIEMLDLSREYDAVVIDEAQMLSDRDRGGSWTAAILGAVSPLIHVCAALEAEDILIRMITDCGDTYEIVRHERMTPLIVESRRFKMEKDTKKGDALIVFSRNNVHAVAAELHDRGFKTSIIYGALPYDVRHEQARLFSEGHSDVVVATDAIGMGMNLPIRRIVFLENDKYDGVERRPLKDEEIRQIAGRAGRYGIYNEGYVTSEAMRSSIKAALEAETVPLLEAVIAFPEILLKIDATLPEILEKWDQIKIHEGYVRADTKRMIALCQMIRKLSSDKDFLYRCITVTFDEKNQLLLSHWKQMCEAEAGGKSYQVRDHIPSRKRIAGSQGNLDELEEMFRLCDLLYNYCDRFDHEEYTEELMKKKALISRHILEALAKQKLKSRTCRICGRKLAWNYPFSLCENCFRRRRHY